MKHQDQIDRAAGEAALRAAAEVDPRPTALVELSSRGRVLVVGGDSAWTAAKRMTDPLRPVVVSGEPQPQTLAHCKGLEIEPGTELALRGHLGAFVLHVNPSTDESLKLEADLVLDLNPLPLVDGRMPPPGYFRPADASEELEAVLPLLADMVGVFEKPTYFQYDPQACAHRRNGITACTRCIDSCPTEAIISIGDRVEVNPNLCQGLGSCATACPSGAIRYSYPGPQDSLLILRTLLNSYREAGGQRPRLLLHEAAAGADWVKQRQSTLADSVIPLQLEDIASLGLEAWLCALAFGASDIGLLIVPGTPAKVQALLEEQIAVCSALLEGMGYDGSRVRLLRPDSPDNLSDELGDVCSDELASPATFTLSDGKRDMAFWALDHLRSQAPALRPLVNLPAGAPFGAAGVSAKDCTLCLSCVGACPGGALQDGYDKPELRFIEANCLQCGMCTRVCPEDAIWITPRFLFDAEARRRPRVLHHEAPFECVSCSKPFATRSVIERMVGRLGGHYMFRDERAKRRLMMCEDCRVADIAQDPDAMAAGMRLHGHQ